jgi:branched-chain amino acid transport system substrate-binding protein
MEGGRRRLVVVAAAGLAMFACSLGPNQPQPLRYGADVVIGVPLSFTGNLSLEAGMAKQGYDLFLDWVNSTEGGLVVQGVRHRVRLLYEDDQSSPVIAGQLAEKMITLQKAQFLLGPYGAANTAAVAAVAEAHHVPLVSANGSATSIFSKGYRYVFGVQTPAVRNLQPIFDLAATLNPRPATVAMLTASDPFSQEVARGATDYAPMKGFRIVSNQQYQSGSTNLFNLLTQAKTAKPDIIVNSGHLIEALAINKAAKALNFQAKIFAYSVGPTMPDFTQTLGQDANYVFTGSQWTAQARYTTQYYLTVPQYVAAYRKKFNTQLEPNYQVADATAAGIALEEAIERGNSLRFDKVRNALQRLDIQTFYGRIRFDTLGQNSFKPMFVEQIQSQRRATVWPPEMASTAAQYPTPDWTVRSGAVATAAAPPAATLPKTGVPIGGGG